MSITCRRRISRFRLTDFYGRRKKPPLAVGDYAAATRRGGVRGTLRAMCEASRGRQLRLIRAETDSGRSDGLLNTLTCRQPSARLHFLHPSPYVACDVTELRPARRARRRRVIASRNYTRPYVRVKICQLISHIPFAPPLPIRDPELTECFFDDSNHG